MPYRLVTTGSDGLARMWDIREAAINRYGAHVGKREDYTLPLAGNGRSTNGSEEAGASSSILASGDELLPPLPLRNGGSVEDGPAGSQGNAGDGAENVAVGAGNAAGGGGEAGGGDVQPGQFVRNDVLDEGVRLVTKLQHGAPPDQNLPGASTRSRRKAVKVICIARCPKGGHFATGAEDGICRVWSEEDGGDVIAKQDNEHAANYFQSGQRPAERRSARVQHQSEGKSPCFIHRCLSVFSMSHLLSEHRATIGRAHWTCEFDHGSSLFTCRGSHPHCESEGWRCARLVLDGITC